MRYIRATAGSIILVLLSLGACSEAAERLDLTGCVRRALAANPQVQDAQDVSAAAEIGRRVARAEYHFKVVPSVDGGLQGANKTNQRYDVLFSRKLLSTGTQFGVSGGTHVFSTVPQLSVPYFTETRLSVTQPVLQGRTRLENRDRLDDAERRIASSHHALDVAREDLTLRVVERFYDVVRAARLVEVGDQSLARVRALGEIARAKLALGVVSKMDVYRTDLHGTRLQNTLVEQSAQRDAGLDSLKILLGVDPRVPLEIDLAIQGPAAADLAGEAATERALERRIEVIEAREQVTDVERKLLLARYRLWPALDLVGFYARQGIGDSVRDSFDLRREEWNVGVRSTVPLDRTLEEAAIAEAQIALRREERTYRVVRDAVVAEVRESLRQLARARAGVGLAAEILEQTEQQAELARFRYEKGVTDNFDLVQAEQQRAEAEGAHALARIDEAVAAAGVRRATGTLTEAFGAAEPLPLPVPESEPQLPCAETVCAHD